MTPVRKLVQYRVRENALPQALAAVQTFVAAVKKAEPATDYVALHLANEADFIHVMTFSDAAAEAKHQQAPYTKAFVKTIYPLCEDEPFFVPVEKIA